MANEERELKYKITGDASSAVGAANAATAANAEIAKGAEKTAGALGDTTKAAKDGSEAIKELGRRGSASKDVFEGLTQVYQGGAGAIFGIAKAWKNLGEAFKFNPIGAAVAVVTAGLGIIKGGLDLLVSRAEKARDKLYGTGEATAKLKDGIAALEEQTKKSTDAQLTEIEKLTRAYDSLLARIDAGDARTKASVKAQLELQRATLDRDEQKALLGATTDEQRKKINDSFAQKRGASTAAETDAEFENLANKARLQRDEANKQAGRVRGERTAAENETAGKVAAADDARATAFELAKRKGAASPETKAAITDAQLAAKAAELAKQKLAEVVEATDKALDRINAQLDEAKAGAELATLGKQARAATVEAETLKARAADALREKEIREAASNAQAAGDNVGQSKAQAELRALEAARRAREALARREIGGLKNTGNYIESAGAEAAAIRTMDAQTGFIRKGSAELLEAQQRSAAAFLEGQARLKAAHDKATRQALNGREQ